MADKLLIFLHPDDLTHPSWVVFSDSGEVSNSSLRDETDGLAQIAIDKEVNVLVPAPDVLLIQINLPKMNRARLLEALPFAIEDQLISEVESLHFALGKEEMHGQIPVAIVAKDKMREWINLLESWQIKADSFIPASLALPYAEKIWTCGILDETLLVRMDRCKGFGGDQYNLMQLLELSLSESSQLPEKIYFYNTTDASISSILNLPIAYKEEEVSPKSLIEACAQTINQVPAINLLQGSFAVKQNKTQLYTLKKWIAYVSVFWGLSLILYPSISYVMLEKKVNEQDQEIAQIYKRHFPKSTAIVAPKIRMQEKLKKLSANFSEDHLLNLLGFIGKSLTTIPSIKLKRFDFRDNELSLELLAESEDLSTFTELLTTEGLNVNQQNASFTGSRINTTLVIR